MHPILRVALTGAVVPGSALASPAFAQVGVSVNVPGIYGQIDIGGYPPPQTIYAQPTVIERAPGYGEQPPLYLHVPTGQERQWKRYCRQYDACGRPVYFVRDTWYRNVYTPHYRQMHGGDDRRGPPPGRNDRDDRGHDDRRHDDRGHDDHGPDDRGRGH